MCVFVTQAAIESLTTNFDEYLKFADKTQNSDDGKSLELLLAEYSQWKVSRLENRLQSRTRRPCFELRP